jgi:hypothetical protein
VYVVSIVLSFWEERKVFLENYMAEKEKGTYRNFEPNRSSERFQLFEIQLHGRIARVVVFPVP